MRIFLIRFLLFSTLWAIMLYETSSQRLFSLFMLTASLAIFFMLSYRHAYLSLQYFVHYYL
ncbi:MAG TPA: hypothetical protein VK085_02120 [Pseudogracilibacillus sp.]|nr:hypothetical protein [Pseudogracilibacillus sp.]